MLLCIWSGCGGLFNRVAVADVKRWGRGDAPYRAWSRCSSINDTRVASSNAVASIGRGPICTAKRCQSVGCWMWYACQLAVWWSAAARNVRRRPWKPNVINKMGVVVVSF